MTFNLDLNLDLGLTIVISGDGRKNGQCLGIYHWNLENKCYKQVSTEQNCNTDERADRYLFKVLYHYCQTEIKLQIKSLKFLNPKIWTLAGVIIIGIYHQPTQSILFKADLMYVPSKNQDISL